MDTIQRAVLFAAEKHKEQFRKGTNIPYIVHPLGVMEILTHAGASNDAIVAGILHDILEDTDTTYDELAKNFGTRIADIVKFCTEPDKSLPWEERKFTTFEKLKKCKDEECLAVFFADKIHNFQSLHRDWIELGFGVWSRFNRNSESQMWYYGRIYKFARSNASKCGVVVRHLMYDFWWEYDKMTQQLQEYVDGDFDRKCAGIDREDYTPNVGEFAGTTPWERAIGKQEIAKKHEHEKKTISKTLKRYNKLASERSRYIISNTKEDKIVRKMQELKAQFTAQDWDDLIYSCPVFMRPMIAQQRDKYFSREK